VWVPAGVTHSIEMSGRVAMRSIYFAPGFARRRLPRSCNVVHVTPLMRELILQSLLDWGAAARFPVAPTPEPRDRRPDRNSA
jgi:hypothetical protein